ncbi:unnamed protein product [Adineta steineri]|uniref:F-box domain-containing protein n=1 Tax=Adineta steineri TaxID=433720 RepID=A0A814NMR9_9BILA|nr:unnamed protein product [Adineta steineri]CAF4106359.1 unnamed protein product [Adineta steineri]
MLFFAFDRLPVELILMIFQYLSGNDIFLSFLNTSFYINNILKSYNKYSLNFISSTREKFDYILSNIELNKIISLTLSNGELTGGQFNLFLSKYSSSFYLFNNLYSLTLHCIQMKKTEYIQLIEAFKQFQNLRLLYLNQISLIDIDDCFISALNQLNSHCLIKLNNCEQLNISSLSNKLQYWKSNCFNFYRQQWTCLRAIQLKDLSRTSLNHLLHLTPQLISLIIECEIDKNTSSPNFRLVPNLKQLIFSCQNLTFHYLIVEIGLDTLSKLKHLQIKCNTSTDELIFNGDQWKIFLSQSFSYLIKFDFCFKYSYKKSLSLNTFRTQFWLEDKKWFVALCHCQYSNNLELFTVPCFNTTIKLSQSIIDTTSPSFEYLTSNIHRFDNSCLIDKNNNYDILLDSHRYEYIDILDIIIQNKFDSISWLTDKLNLNSIKIIKLDLLCSWIVDYKQILDLLEYMPNVFKVILNSWPKKDSWLQIKKGNSRINSIELPALHKTNDNRLPSGLKPIFSHLFPSIKHIYMYVHYPELCYQLDIYTLPWKNLSSLQIKYFFSNNITEDEDEDEKNRYNIWKEIFLNEILPIQSQRNFTFTDVDNKLNIWFGEIIENKDKFQNNNQIEKVFCY